MAAGLSPWKIVPLPGGIIVSKPYRIDQVIGVLGTALA
jgi:hypothetical protein